MAPGWLSWARRTGWRGAAAAAVLLTVLLAAGALERRVGTMPSEGLPSAGARPAVTQPPAPPVVTGISPDWGVSGQKVTIRGKGFSHASGVSFGVAPARIRVVSDGVIVTWAPKGEDAVAVTVSTPLGVSAATSYAEWFTYVDRAAIGRAEAATAQLEVSEGNASSLCSAVLVAPSVILTAKHCVGWPADKRAASYTVAFYLPSGEVDRQAQPLAEDERHDLAALVLASRAPVAPAPVRAAAPVAGDLVFFAGYPGPGSAMVERAGRVLNGREDIALDDGRKYPDMTVTDIVLRPGESGGPLLDADGEVVGIASLGLTFGEGDSPQKGSAFVWAPDVEGLAREAGAGRG